MTFGGSTRYYLGNLGPLNLAFPPWIRAMSIDAGFGHGWGRKDEFCVAVTPVTSTAGILVYCTLA